MLRDALNVVPAGSGSCCAAIGQGRNLYCVVSGDAEESQQRAVRRFEGLPSANDGKNDCFFADRCLQDARLTRVKTLECLPDGICSRDMARNTAKVSHLISGSLAVSLEVDMWRSWAKSDAL